MSTLPNKAGCIAFETIVCKKLQTFHQTLSRKTTSQFSLRHRLAGLDNLVSDSELTGQSFQTAASLGQDLKHFGREKRSMAKVISSV